MTTDRRVAYVSGGSSGIGYGIAEALLDDGYAVTITARRPDKLADAAARLAEHGEVHHVAANAASEEELQTAFASHRERFGRLDVLVNNAGVGAAGPVEETQTRALDLQLAVNVRSVILTTAHFVDLLRASPSAHIVNVSSIAGVQGEASLATYSATKHGVVGFTQALQRELGPDGIKATAICPAFVDTAMAGWVAERVGGAGRLIQVSDIVGVVLAVLRLSRWCNVPLVVFEPPGGGASGLTSADLLAAARDARGG